MDLSLSSYNQLLSDHEMNYRCTFQECLLSLQHWQGTDQGFDWAHSDASHVILLVVTWKVYYVLWEALPKNVVIPIICGVVAVLSCPTI